MPRRLCQPYQNRWRILRDAVLVRDSYTCWSCKGHAVTADHIVPRSEAPWLEFEPSNLRATCTKCNSARVTSRMARMAQINHRTPPERVW